MTSAGNHSTGRSFSLPGRSPGRGLTLLALLLMLSACGFQPRGESVRSVAALGPLWLTGLADHHPFLRELRHELLATQGSLADSPEQAQAVLRVRRLDSEREVFSVNANNKAVEYEVTHTLVFSLERPAGKTLLDGETLTSRHLVYDPGGELLGRSREAALQRQDAWRDLSRRLINRLAAHQ